MKQKNVLLVATETAPSPPFPKTGVLGNVVFGLAKELCRQGHDARIIVPCYRGVLDRSSMRQVISELLIPLGAYERMANVWKVDRDPIVYLVDDDHSFYFGRDDLYGYLDDYERFIFFTRVAMEMLCTKSFNKEENGWFPDIIQGYDWACGLIPGWLLEYREKFPQFQETRFVLSVYNIGRPGIFHSRALRVAKQEQAGIFDLLQEDSERINFLGRGILGADKVVTVNPDYGSANPLPNSSQSLRDILNLRKETDDLIGIGSGIDYDEYNPSQDTLLYYPFKNSQERLANKRTLQVEYGLLQDSSVPLLGMVSRLIFSKGVDLLPGLENLLSVWDFQLVLLADPGDIQYQAVIEEWEKNCTACKIHRKPFLKVFYGFDEKLARRIYAACDIFLVPSYEEPAGVQQFVAMHYGAVPVVHRTGVLGTSIVHHQPDKRPREYSTLNTGVGFLFDDSNHEAFSQTVQQAVEIYHSDLDAWQEIQSHNMRANFSWNAPAVQYYNLYEQILAQEPRYWQESDKILILDPNMQLIQAILEIDSLPGVKIRKEEVLLKQAARLVREAVHCDAVYVWALEAGTLSTSSVALPQEIHLVSQSLEDTRQRPTPQESELTTLLSQGFFNVWKQYTELDVTAVPRPILGLEQSDLAQQQGWVDGRSVLITAHSRLLGRIDVLFRESVLPEQEKWLASALTTLANSFGFRLETIRLSREKDRILKTDNRLLQARSLHKAVEIVVKQAQSITHADFVDLFNTELQQIKITPLTISMQDLTAIGREAAKQSIEGQQVVYIRDLSVMPNSTGKQFDIRSLMAVPLMNMDENTVIGVLEVASKRPAAFSRDQEQMLIQHLAPQAAAVFQTTRWYERRDRSRVEQLQMLTNSLTGRADFQELLDRVVKTTAEVLEAQAASLYLLDENGDKLTIKAAYGTHKPLLKIPAWYNIGEGVTGYIAEQSKILMARSIAELQEKVPSYKGKYLKEIGGCTPNAFLGIPLVVNSDSPDKKRVIGVLKLEDRPKSTNRLDALFSEEDVRLAELAAQVIVTVVYSALVSDAQVQNIGNNIKVLSDVLAGSREKSELVDKIVGTTARVLGAEASSLYLIDEITDKLVIQAATGYQKPLVQQGATYTLGEGITGWIAAKGKLFRANDLNALHEHPAWAGKQNPGQRGREPRSFLGLPLKVVDRYTGKEKVIGVLKVEDIVPSPKHPEAIFTDQDVLLVTMMANIIAVVVYNTQVSDNQLQKLNDDLGELSKVLAGSREMSELVDKIVDTTAHALSAEASSLYLIDEVTGKLVIRAATGYQKPLVRKRATYTVGEGVTGWIAAKEELFRANDLDALHQHPAWAGKQNLGQGGREPRSFLGLPLKVVDRYTGKDKIIGVLKVEDIVPSQKHPETIFTDQDVLLVTMMANVIAAVVYNTQVSDNQLQKLNDDLGELSKVLAGSREMSELVDKIVDTTARALSAEASSLYLIDEATGKLVIQAATGYQKPLVQKGATYTVGEGVTGWIAAKGELFRANDLDALHQHPAWAGKQNPGQGGREPRSFLGLPLKIADRFSGKEKVIGVLKVEDIVPSPKHSEAIFTDQDVLLVTMMANVITAVIQNTRQGEKRVGEILKQLGTLSTSTSAASDLLKKVARSTDLGILDQLAITIAAILDKQPKQIEEEAKALFEAGANPSIYNRIASWARNDIVKWEFSLLDNVFDISTITSQWEQISRVIEPWKILRQCIDDPEKFANSTSLLVKQLARVIEGDVKDPASDPYAIWYACVLDVQRIFGQQKQLDNIPILFQRQGNLNEDNLDRLVRFAQRGLKRPYSVVVVILWYFGTSEKQINEMRERARAHAVDVVIIDLKQVLQILASPHAPDEFRSIVLRQATYITPFVIVGPVPDALFFGRDQELREIIQYVGAARSCAILGGRRYGKTSVLQRLYRVRLPEAGFRVIYQDCATLSTYEKFLSTPLRNWRPEAPIDAPETFQDLLKSPPVDKSLVMLLDEADKLVPIDRTNGWPIFNMLRSLTNSGHAQIVLSGERTLREGLRDPGSPLFNLANEILLGPLDLQAVDELVTRPIRQLEIELDDEVAIVNHIYSFTAGHPNVVQRLCDRLIKQLNKHSGRRITLDNIKTVIEDPAFQRNDFLSTYWEAATVLEKIISLLMADDEGVRTLTTVRQALGGRCNLDLNAREIDDALQHLVDLRAILKRTPAGYKFAVEAFPRVVAGTMTLDDMLEILIEEYQEQEE
ncbi:MAG: GAF domain-containing protein [Anaerolineae bacterium]|nr:GAF domain-containing protein [Anaerolineae bacterium]